MLLKLRWNKLSSIISLFILICGISYVGFKWFKNIEYSAQTELFHISQEFRSILNETYATALEAGGYLDGGCDDETIRSLSRLNAARERIRSVNLIKNGKWFCSSLEGRASPDILTVNTQTESIAAEFIHRHSTDMYVFYYPFGKAVIAVSVFKSAFDKVVKKSNVNVNLHTQISFDNPSGGFVSMYSPWEIPFKISVSPTHTLSAFFHENIYWLLSLLLFVFALFFVLRGCEKNKQKHSLMKGIKNNEFVPYYQPVVNICDNSIIGVEILARWQHPTQGLVLPSGFIEKVEYYGLTEEMTLSLLLQVEKDILNINAFDQKGFHVAVNVTPPSLNEEWFLRKLTQFIKNMNSIRVSVIIEITERQRAKVNVSSLSKLRQEGAILALDDFGTGYSNYCNISELSPDYLKIDKSFVAEAGNETVNGKIFSNIIGLSKSTCIPLIAEGVENECQLKNILKAGVTFAQGYLFSRPVDVEKFVSLYTLNREKK